MRNPTPKIALSGFTLLVATCFLYPVLGQTASAPSAGRHSLWRVEGKHCSVYLLGSIHVLKAENYPLPAPMQSAFDKAAIAAFETDLDEMEQPATQAKILSQATLPEGETLRSQLSGEVYASFSNHLAASELPAVMFDRFKPSVAVLTLVVLELQKLGLDPQYGLDKHFFPLAKKAGKQVVPLETVDFQVKLVTDFTKEEAELLVMSTLHDLDKVKKEVPALLKAWQTGDAAGIESMLNDASREAPAIFKRLVADRNHNWLPKIKQWAQGDKDAIVIVGAGHLVGKEGLVELLQKEGLKVVQE
jgi:uncharacterized protein YbaP (TraB family)